MRMSLASRIVALCLGMAFAVPFAPVDAQTTAAETFVDQATGKAIAILNDKTLKETDRRQQMQSLISSLLDLRRMALFTLGPAAKSASAADLDAFIAEYRDFALANYTA